MMAQPTPPLSDILDIPGNEAAYQRLRQGLDRGETIAFVGAGASVPLYPLWQGLIRELAGEALRQGRATEDDHAYWLRIAGSRPQQAVRGIKQKLGEGPYGAALGRIFGRKRGVDGVYYTPAHGALMRMPFAGYVTTNYDPGLLEARAQLRPEVGATGYAT
jgi:hypothetical protein